MTLFGVDISNYQAGISIADIKAEGFSWVEAKVSEGNYFADPTWPGFLAEAEVNAMPILGYHYANSTCSPMSQVQCFQGNGGGSVVMIDFEANSGSITDFWALVDAFNVSGIVVVASYIPGWYWQEIGQPDLSQVPGLVSSDYPGATGFASAIYAQVGGDTGPGWAAYGGCQPVIWQFTDRAEVGGQLVDANAFRGDLDQLTALFSGNDMELTDTIVNTAGETVTVEEVFRAIDFHASMGLEQLAGPGASNEPGPGLTAPGWPQLGGFSIVDALATIGAHLGIAGFSAPSGG